MEKELAERMARAVHSQLSDLRQQAVDLQKSYDQVKKQAIELEKSNKAKDDFLNVVSDELRTPLSLISGYAEMMRTKMVGEVNLDQEAALIKIKRHSAELLAMVDSILEAKKFDAGACQLKSYTFSLVDFLDGMRSNYDMPLGKEVALIWDYRDDLPVVTTDGVKLKHTIENLINNAIKFTEIGTVVISARHMPDRSAVEFKVKDTGIGIPSEALPVIFEMFQQVDGSQTRAYGGVGLGLHIVKKFTELLGASIEVESEQDKGSTFIITMPLFYKSDSQRTPARSPVTNANRSPQPA